MDALIGRSLDSLSPKEEAIASIIAAVTVIFLGVLGLDKARGRKR